MNFSQFATIMDKVNIIMFYKFTIFGVTVDLYRLILFDLLVFIVVEILYYIFHFEQNRGGM